MINNLQRPATTFLALALLALLQISAIPLPAGDDGSIGMIASNGSPQVNTRIRPQLGNLDPDAPDLVIASSTWLDQKPVPGDTVGIKGVYRVLVKNNGKTSAKPSIVRFTCDTLSGAPAPLEGTGTLNCHNLMPNHESILAWPPVATGKWREGRYRLRIELDATKIIPETNEANNKMEIEFTVMPPKVQPGPAPAPQDPGIDIAGDSILPKPDLIIQNVKMTPSHPSRGTKILFTITFRNIGKAKSGKAHTLINFFRAGNDGVRYKFNNDRLYLTPKLIAPGEMDEFLYEHDLSPEQGSTNINNTVRQGDTIELEFFIDSMAHYDSLKESDYTNNKKNITFILE